MRGVRGVCQVAREMELTPSRQETRRRAGERGEEGERERGTPTHTHVRAHTHMHTPEGVAEGFVECHFEIVEVESLCVVGVEVKRRLAVWDLCEEQKGEKDRGGEGGRQARREERRRGGRAQRRRGGEEERRGGETKRRRGVAR